MYYQQPCALYSNDVNRIVGDLHVSAKAKNSVYNITLNTLLFNLFLIFYQLLYFGVKEFIITNTVHVAYKTKCDETNPTIVLCGIHSLCMYL